MHMDGRLRAEQQKQPTAISGGLLQRKCDCGTHTMGAAKCSGCSKERQTTLQRSATSRNRTNSPNHGVPPIVHEVLRSSGQPLDSNTRAFMEPRFGHDFSRVRVHTDARAAESAREVNALAYTVGRDVVFGRGQYAPGTSGGLHTLAHELTHALQQGGSNRTVQPKPGVAGEGSEYQSRQVAGQAGSGTLKIGEPGDAFEREADSTAAAVMSTGEPRLTDGQSGAGTLRRLTAPLLQRRLVVNPANFAPLPAGQQGPPDRLTHAVQNLLADTCPAGGFLVNATTGVVTPGTNTFCTSHPPLLAGVREADQTSTPVGCGCICDVIASGQTSTIAYRAGGPETEAVGGTTGTSPASPTVNVDPTFQGQYSINGKWVDVPFYLLLAHELCGHALSLMQGTQVPAGPGPVGGTPPHERRAVDVERQIAGEHNPALPRRPDDYGSARQRP
jgi:hypothetical protein